MRGWRGARARCSPYTPTHTSHPKSFGALFARRRRAANGRRRADAPLPPLLRDAPVTEEDLLRMAGKED